MFFVSRYDIYLITNTLSIMRTLFFVFFVFLQESNAQTLHLIAVSATKDPTIGEGCKVNVSRIERNAEEIKQFIGFNLKKYIFQENDFDSDKVFECFSKIICNPNDVIWFYYSGHGINDDGKYPKFLIQGTKKMTLENTYALLELKKPKLLLCFADCCNFQASKHQTTRSEINERNQSYEELTKEIQKSNYTKLFKEQEGGIISSSSQAGEFSIYNEDLGGFFTLAFFESLFVHTHQKQGSDWEMILNQTKNDTQSLLTSVNSNRIQTPQYDIRKKKQIKYYVVLQGQGLMDIARKNGIIYSEQWRKHILKINGKPENGFFKANEKIIVEPLK